MRSLLILTAVFVVAAVSSTSAAVSSISAALVTDLPHHPLFLVRRGLAAAKRKAAKAQEKMESMLEAQKKAEGAKIAADLVAQDAVGTNKEKDKAKKAASANTTCKNAEWESNVARAELDLANAEVDILGASGAAQERAMHSKLSAMQALEDLKDKKIKDNLKQIVPF